MSATRKPWMKFYAADWRADQALRMCSLAARGLWIECMAIMHEADPYGYLAINGKSLDSASLARLVGSDIADVEEAIAELEQAGVFSLNRAGTIYSRRMIRDEKKAKIARKVGKMGGNPTLGKQRGNQNRDNPEVNREPNGGDNTQRPEARSQKEESIKVEADFKTWYAAYPRHVAPDAAERAYRKARKKASAETLLAGVDFYRETKPDYADWRYPATWLNGGGWKDEASTGVAANGQDTGPYLGEHNDDLRTDYRRLMRWQESGEWMFDWGPKPGEPGCQIAAEVMAKYGDGGDGGGV